MRMYRPLIVEIDAPVDRVWSHLSSIERHVDWMSDAESIMFTGHQTTDIGTVFLCVTKVGPFRLRDHMEVTDWQPGARLGVRHTGIVSGRGVFDIEPLDCGRRSRLTWSETIRFPWYLGSRVGELGAGVVLPNIWRSNLKRFRSLVEAD